MIWQIPPPTLALAPDEIHIWKAPLDGPPSHAQLLSADEQKRASRFLLEKHRNRFIVGRAILRKILSYYLNLEPQYVCFTYQPNGKPELKISGEPRRVQFNLAHTGNLAVYAVTLDQEVGIDVEVVKPNPQTLQIAQRFFSPPERTWLSAQLPEFLSRDFSRLWTLKEAYLKVHGRGLGFPLDQFTILPGQMNVGELSVYELEPEKGYVAALMGYGCRKRLITYSYLRYDP